MVEKEHSREAIRRVRKRTVAWMRAAYGLATGAANVEEEHEPTTAGIYTRALIVQKQWRWICKSVLDNKSNAILQL